MWTPIRGPDWMPITPKMGSLFGSDPLLVTIGSPRAGDARLEQIEFSAPIHLTLNQLELANLTLGLAIRPTRRDRGAHRGLVLRDAVHECRNETRVGALDPRIEFGQRPSSDHGLEIGNDFARLDQKLDAALNRDDGYSLGLREPIALDRHQPGDGSGRGSAAYRACIHLF